MRFSYLRGDGRLEVFFRRKWRDKRRIGFCHVVSLASDDPFDDSTIELGFEASSE